MMGMTDIAGGEPPKDMKRARMAAETAVMNVTFDRRSGTPLFQQLTYHIVHAISTGRIEAGTPLPSVRALAHGLGVAASTVQRAYARLQEGGFVVGEGGRGVFVAALTDRHSAHDVERALSLHGLLSPAVTQAKTLGFSDTEIVATLQKMLAGGVNEAPASRVVFVGRGPVAVDKYIRLLRPALSSLRCDVVGTELPDLMHNDGAILDELRPIDLLVCPVSIFGEVRRIGRLRDIDTYGLRVELSDQTKRSLLEIPFESRIGLVAEPEFLSNTRALVEQIRGSEPDVIWASDQPIETARDTIGGCDVVLHTFGTPDLAAELAAPTALRIELIFLPMKASLEHLADTVASFGAASPDGQDAGGPQ
jgi:GntR family transcriptional regulator